jgi:hypothetical protein
MTFENAVCRVERFLGKFVANSSRILLKLKRSRFLEIRTIGAILTRADGWSNACGRPFRQPSVHHATHHSPCNPPFTIPPECSASRMGKPRLGAPKSRGSICLSVRLSGV